MAPPDTSSNVTEPQRETDDEEALESATSNSFTLSLKSPIVVVGLVVAVLLILNQFYLLSSLQKINTDLETSTQNLELTDQFTEQISDLESSMDYISDRIDGLADEIEDAADSSSTDDTTLVVPSEDLPRYPEQGADQAIGRTLASIEGSDPYTDEAIIIDPTDGTKRVWMVWAHWCPYCQEELPELNAWWPESSGNYPSVELVTITTSIDPSRGNPLDEYLEESQFVFTIVEDPDNEIVAKMGVNAFPFWLITDGAGTVLYRSAGRVGIERVEQLFGLLEEYSSDTNA